MPIFVLFANFAAAEENMLTNYQTEITLTMLLIVVLLFILYIAQRKEFKETETKLKEKEEKIAWLRQVHAQNDYRNTQRIQELEKEVLQLEHTVEKLETKLKEGTKNQVVAKLEALRSARENAQSRIKGR